MRVTVEPSGFLNTESIMTADLRTAHSWSLKRASVRRSSVRCGCLQTISTVVLHEFPNLSPSSIAVNARLNLLCGRTAITWGT